MALFYASEFVFIGKGDESFLENYSYELSEDPDGSGGKIYMSLEILNNQAEAEDIGEAIFAVFKQKFYEHKNADPFDRFEEALKEVNGVIETLKEEKVSRFIGNLNIALGAMVGDTLYISTTGDSEVYLVRKRFVSIVSEGLAEDSKKETFVNIANGGLEPDDRVIFSSSRLLRYITKGELGKIFGSGGSIGRALTELQDFIMTEILGRSAVIGIAISEEEREGEQEEERVAAPSRMSAFFQKLPRLKFLSRPSHLPTGQAGSEAKQLLRPKGATFFALSEKLPRLSSAFSSIWEKIANLIPQKPSPKIHFREKLTKERILILVVLLLALLIGGTFWIRTRGDTKRQIAEQQTKLNHARELVNDATTVGQFDKPKASELLLSAEKLSIEVLNSRFVRGEAVKMLDEIQKNRDTLDEIKRVSSPTLLADFSDKRATVSALGLLALKDRLYGFEYNALYEMVLDKLQEPATIPDVESVILGTDFPDRNMLLFLTRTGKMIQFGDGRFSLVSTKDGIWKKGVDMKTYNDRVYILDPERNQIWRYARTRDSFETGAAYNQNADLKTAVSLAIDSSVYVLHSDGTVTQLYQGQKQEYPLRRPPLNALAAPTKIFTNADLTYLYILEPGKNRVVVFRKDPKNNGAQYQTQYVFEKTGVLRDLVVSENRLYVMDDKRVYFVNLSGL